MIPCFGLYWFRTASTEKAINVSNNGVFSMDNLDGNWNDITGSVLDSTSTNFCDFTTFNGKLLFTNNKDLPQSWTGSGSCINMTVVANLSQAKFIENFNNYCLMANVIVSGDSWKTRVYWSAYKDETTWSATDFTEIGFNDGQPITGFKVLGDRLVVYKTNSIYVMLFTGDANVPFIVQKTNSHVGCVAPWSIQECDNGHIFLAYDGLYYFDGANCYKMSDKINGTIQGLNRSGTSLEISKSIYQKDRNRYWLSVPVAGSDYNNKVIIWDSFNNAFSQYAGISASAMQIFWVNGVEERPYFADYSGYTYRADYGLDDYPLKSQTAINAYYYTNWKHFEDICDKKGIPHAYVYHSNTNGALDFAYSYDFHTNDQYVSTFTTLSTDSITNISVRRDMTGRGRVVRIKLANSQTTTSFQIDGIGFQANLQTKA